MSRPERLRARSHNESYAPFDTAEKMDFEVFGMNLTAWLNEQL